MYEISGFTSVLPAQKKATNHQHLLTEFTTPLLCFDDGLVAGPKEIFLADGFYETTAFHHIMRVVVDSCEHERAALLVESFVQTVNGFDSCCVYQ